MNPLERDLKRLIKGDVLFDDVTRHIYSFGASIYKIRPKGVIMPKDKDDVVRLVKYASQNAIPLIPRGACTSLAGQAVGSGLILDFTKYMNRLKDYDGGFRVEAEPGVVYGELNRTLKRFGNFFPPDPSSGNYCTIGGMVAGNSGGPHSVKYGSVCDWCEELDVVLASGDSLRLRPGVRIASISERLEALFRHNKDNILKYAPKVKRNASGYNVCGAADGGDLDLAKLIVGSEGTLAIITGAGLKLAKIPKRRAVLLLFLEDRSALGEAISGLAAFEPAALEFMDDTFMRLARGVEPRVKDVLRQDAAGVFLVEFEGEGPGELDKTVASVKDKFSPGNSPISEMKIARDTEEEDRLWSLRRSAVPIMNRVKGDKRPIPFIEDAIVPPDVLDEFIICAYDIFEKYSVEACVYGHAGDGNMHIRPLLNLKDKADLIKMENIAGDFYRMVIAFGGSTTAEHGDGILRLPYVKKQFGPLHAMFMDIKDIFDPKDILNPGKKIGDNKTIAHDLVYAPETEYVATHTDFDSDSLRRDIEKCHACGLCRSICPMNSNQPQEAASPRAKATILKALINGQFDRSMFFEPAVKDMLEACFNCKSCRVECPTGADISRLCAVAKEYYVKKAGVRFTQLFFEDIHLMGSLASRVPNAANIIFGMPAARAIMELVLGIDRRRRFPSPSVPAFTKRCLMGKGKKRKVAYFYGCYVNFFNANEGNSVLKVLQKNEIEVIFPPQKCCGIPSISSGNIEMVRQEMAYNIKHLYNAVKDDFDIITSCPSCGLALKEDYPRILNNTEAIIVSQRVFDIHEYLWFLFNEGTLNTNFKNSNKDLAFHSPCHLKAQGASGLQECLVKLIPGVSDLKISDSCCGMAGTYGLKKKNYDLSMEAGRKLFDELKSVSADYVVTSCGACKTQITQATASKVIHPIEFLAENYI